MTTKAPTRGKLTHDHELLVISRMFDLVATLRPERRAFALEYVTARLQDMPVLAEVEAVANGEEQPALPLRGAA